MKLYKCKKTDKTIEGWEECVIAVMESEEEEQTYLYYCRNRLRYPKFAKTMLLLNSGYTEWDENEVDVWFLYEVNGYNLADAISKNISQWISDEVHCDSYYMDFEFIEPNIKRGGIRKSVFEVYSNCEFD